MLIVISSLSQFHFDNFYFCTVYYLLMLFLLPRWRIKSLIYIYINEVKLLCHTQEVFESGDDSILVERRLYTQSQIQLCRKEDGIGDGIGKYRPIILNSYLLTHIFFAFCYLLFLGGSKKLDSTYWNRHAICNSRAFGCPFTNWLIYAREDQLIWGGCSSQGLSSPWVYHRGTGP